MIDKERRLSSGHNMPTIGFGVYKVDDGQEVEGAVASALEVGYRLIDTAAYYENESGVGKAVSGSRIPREEIFITTKLKNSDHGYENTLRAFNQSLKELNMAYVDLYLIHWPSADEDRFIMVNKRQETWRAMESILESGKARSIGVSNFTIEHLKEMEEYANHFPVVNQVEFHPFLYQEELLKYCDEMNVVIEAYSPLVKARKMANEVLVEISEKYQKTPAQILIRWSIQHGCVPLPKSVTPDRIKENFNVFDFDMSDEDMVKLDSLNQNEHQAWNPYKLS